MSDFIINTNDNVDLVTNSISVTENTVEVVSNENIESTVFVDPVEYYLTSQGIYTGKLIDGYPSWLVDYVSSAISTDMDPVIAVLTDRISQVEVGVNQNITNIQNVNTSLSALETTVVARLDTNEAGIATLEATKVTSTEATAIAASVVSSSFGGDIDAYISSIAYTFVDDNSAVVQDINTLSAAYGDQQVQINTVEQIAIEGNEWAASASKLITAPDGSITGWEFADGSNTQSYFKINTQNFQVSDGTNLANVPFTIQTGTPNRVLFDGVVSFSNTNMTSYTNTNISINADGTLNNAGSGSVTPTGIGTYDGTTIDTKDSTVDSNAQGYASTAESNANTYTDGQITTISTYFPEVVTFTYAPTTEVYPENTIWRQEISKSINGVPSTTVYDHWISNGAGSWSWIGGTYIDGSTLVTGSVDAVNMKADTVWISGNVQSGGTNPFEWTTTVGPNGFALSANGIEDPNNAGDFYNIVGSSIYGSYIVGANLNVGNIEVTTIAGYPTRTFHQTVFGGNGGFIVSSLPYSKTIPLRIFAFDSSTVNTNGYRLATQNSSQFSAEACYSGVINGKSLPVVITTSETDMILYAQIFDLVITNPGTGNTVTIDIDILLGTTVLTTSQFQHIGGDTTNATSISDMTTNNITFKVEDSKVNGTKTLSFGLSNYNVPNLSGDGELAVKFTISGATTGTITRTQYPVKMTIINL